MENLEYLSDHIENLEPIEGFNDCVADKTSYRMGEYWTLTYDFDKFRNKLGMSEAEFLNHIYKNFDYNKISFVKFISKPTRNKIAKYDNKILFADGFDNALVGVRFGFEDNKNIAVYDYDECITALTDEQDMDEEEAIEHIEYNTLGAYVGEYTPCFLMDL